jgi:hypothetical protein
MIDLANDPHEFLCMLRIGLIGSRRLLIWLLYAFEFQSLCDFITRLRSYGSPLQHSTLHMYGLTASLFLVSQWSGSQKYIERL